MSICAARPRRYGRRHAFSLVELLVVVGIIAILIGILLPVVTKARVAAQRVACRAQLADINRLFQMYLNDSRSRLPRVNTLPSLAPPLNDAPSIVQLLEPYTKTATAVWRCPSDRIITETPGTPPGFGTYFDREQSSYRYNPMLSALYAGQQLNDTPMYQQGKQDLLAIFFDYEPFHGRPNTRGAM